MEFYEWWNKNKGEDFSSAEDIAEYAYECGFRQGLREAATRVKVWDDSFNTGGSFANAIMEIGNNQHEAYFNDVQREGGFK